MSRRRTSPDGHRFPLMSRGEIAGRDTRETSEVVLVDVEAVEELPHRLGLELNLQTGALTGHARPPSGDSSL